MRRRSQGTHNTTSHCGHRGFAQYCITENQKKLRLKSLVRPSQKAFITAGGELSFPVGEIPALPLTIGGCTIRVSCMVLNKACFNILLGLDVMKPARAVVDLFQDQFTFTDQGTKQRVTVPLTCLKNKKTLSDVKMVQKVHQINMSRMIPAHEGPLTGQTFFPELDRLSPTAQAIVDNFRATPVGKTSKKIKKRIQLKEKKPKAAVPFLEGAHINGVLSPEQRQQVTDILLEFQAAFVSDSPILPSTTQVQHVIDTGSATPIYVPPYRCSKAEEEVIQ